VTDSSGPRASTANLTWHPGRMSREERWDAVGASGGTVWFTGLSGSGKSTVAAAVELRLVTQGRPAYRLDGDNLRSGLNADLDFSRPGREENIRRVTEVACLFADAGVVALVALISPYRASRDHARSEHERLGLPFVEVHMAVPIEVCAERDPKGLYARVSSGGIPSFTGVDDPYEVPESPDLVLRPDVNLDEAVEKVLECLGRSSAQAGPQGN
jgi:bifunctional enzyme CysN/CysC